MEYKFEGMEEMENTEWFIYDTFDSGETFIYLKGKSQIFLTQFWPLNDEWWMMNDEWWMMNDEWWMMNDEWWMMNDEWWMINDEW